MDSRFQDYPKYGGRGISFDPRWEDFRNFLADMGLCPAGMTLERCDNNLGYGPANCIWADRKAQANNFSRNKLVAWQGETRTLAQWADDPRLKQRGITYYVLRARLGSLKWSVEKAITQPVTKPSAH